MKFSIVHTNINITNMERSIEFYKKALGLEVFRRFMPEDKSFEIVYLTDEDNAHKLELTWLRDKEGSYNLGDNELHIAFVTEDFEEAHALHKEMGCICYENEKMGIYFINDPDGYWLEVMPKRK
ncbi:MAG: VOC family protein [Defluviitaleaceae bacterium]|nr:VOC family protein [Defluviitaleaceae bacterium]